MVWLSASPALAFDFIGLFYSDRVNITAEKGFDVAEVTVKRGGSLEFKNNAAESLRIIIQEMNISTPPIEYDGSARVTFTRVGNFEVLCGKPCPKPLKVAVIRKVR
jgi:plastocyanin